MHKNVYKFPYCYCPTTESRAMLPLTFLGVGICVLDFFFP